MNDSTPTTTTTVAVPVTVGIAAEGPCIMWTGYRNRQGYGQRTVDGRNVLAHRHAWTLANGDPGAWNVCHRCDVRTCINVAHMFLGTHADNMADRDAKGRDAKGERSGMAKLTADQVREMRASTESGVAIAHRLGVDRSTVSKIRLRKIWVHIP